MTTRIIPLSQADDQQVKTIVDLHRLLLPSLLADLGSGPLEWFYRAAMTESGAVGMVALREGRVGGWVVGSSEPWALFGSIRRPFWRFFSNLAQKLPKNPNLVWQLVQSLRSGGDTALYPPESIELLYLGVDPETQGSGLGAALVETFLNAAYQLQFRRVTLSVEVENVRAYRLYHKAGFTELGQVQEGRYQRHRMQRILGQEILSSPGQPG